MIAILLTLGLPIALAQDTSDALELAYQREFAYLKAEKVALQERQRAHATEAQQRLREAEANISGLEARLLTLERTSNDVEARIVQVEDASFAAADAQDLIDATVSQAGETLGLAVPDGLSDRERLQAVFGAALAGLEAGASVRHDEGAFFTPDGTQVHGQRIFVGQVAAYGVSEQGTGALLPIGDGHLQLRPGDGGASDAAALAAGQVTPSVGVFLFESVDQPIHERQAQTLSDVMAGGGIVGWVIVALGALALLLSAFRAVVLVMAGRGTSLVEQVAARVAAGDLSGAKTLVSGKGTPVTRVMAAILEGPGQSRDSLQDIASEALLQELPAIERFGALIIVVAAVAPLLGLLGTVTGMIATFEIITEFGTGDPKMLSGGISEALITTQLGLVVAIPAVLLGNTLKGQADAVVATIERAALRVLNLLAGDAAGPTANLKNSPHGMA